MAEKAWATTLLSLLAESEPEVQVALINGSRDKVCEYLLHIMQDMDLFSSHVRVLNLLGLHEDSVKLLPAERIHMRRYGFALLPSDQIARLLLSPGELLQLVSVSAADGITDDQLAREVYWDTHEEELFTVHGD